MHPVSVAGLGAPSPAAAGWGEVGEEAFRTQLRRQAQRHPPSFPGEQSLSLLIPVASCSPRQAPSGPKRKLEKDFICQLPSSITEKFAFLGTTDP